VLLHRPVESAARAETKMRGEIQSICSGSRPQPLLETSMRVQFKIEGGLAAFPGLSKPRQLNSADLPAADANRLSQLIDAAHFFDLPAESRSLPKGAADY